MNTYVIKNRRPGTFLDSSNHWTDIAHARAFLTLREAQERKQAMTRSGYHAQIIKNHGTESEEVIF